MKKVFEIGNNDSNEKDINVSVVAKTNLAYIT